MPVQVVEEEALQRNRCTGNFLTTRQDLELILATCLLTLRDGTFLPSHVAGIYCGPMPW